MTCNTLSNSGATSLDGKGVADTVSILHPFTTFDDNKQYYDDKASTTYYANVWNAVIKTSKAQHHSAARSQPTRRVGVRSGARW